MKIFSIYFREEAEIDTEDGDHVVETGRGGTGHHGDTGPEINTEEVIANTGVAAETGTGIERGGQGQSLVDT